MSSHGLLWAFDTTGISPVAKLTLIYLADCGMSFEPKTLDLAVLIEFSGATELVVGDAIAELVGRGLISVSAGVVRLNCPSESYRHDEDQQDVMASPKDEGFIYFVQQGRFIKIGTSKNPVSRIKSLRNATAGEPIEVLKIIKGGRFSEKQLHDRFSEIRVNGEWFESTPTLRKFIIDQESAMVVA